MFSFSHIKQKDRLFCEAVFLVLFKKNQQLIVELGSHLASDTSLSKELQDSNKQFIGLWPSAADNNLRC